MLFMSVPRFLIKKIWTDIDFFEVNLKLMGNDCTIDLDIYLDNASLDELREGIVNFAERLGTYEYTWITGHETENTTHFLSLRFFLAERRGIVGIEVKVDNKMDPPYNMRSNFYILTEINQIDDLVGQLERFIKEETLQIESII